MAPLFIWNDSYSVKVTQCDQQHQKLFALINDLGEAMRLGKGQEVIGGTLTELVAYTQTHFQQEEALMQRADYPQLAAHKELHRKFVGEVQALQQQGARAGGTVKVLNLMRDWLVNHIQKADKAYSAHMNAAGIH